MSDGVVYFEWWPVKSILRRYKKSTEEDRDVIYTHAICLQFRYKYGLVMYIDDFIHDVEEGYLTDYDGSGTIIDPEKDEAKGVAPMDVEELKSLKAAGIKYIIWYNK